MQKVVKNICYGGFGLSTAGIRAYAERKSLTLYPEETRFGLTTWWVVPPEDRGGILPEEDFAKAPLEARAASNKAHSEKTLSDSDIPRDDSDLVAVVEQIGAEAAGRFAELAIAEVPDGVEWQIEEYDGTEWVAEKHRTW